MSNLLDLAWLIPTIPFAEAIFVLILLISFNRTMNRLTKPVALLGALSVGLSTLFSFVFFQKHLSGQV